MRSDGTYNGGTAMDGFAERLQKLRIERKPVRARQTVAGLCGLPPDAIRRYERGEAKPTMDALIRIADYYEVSLDYLVGRVPYR